MFITKKEKEELNNKIDVLKEDVKFLKLENIDLHKKVNTLDAMFKMLIEINGAELSQKINEATKTIYNGFKDLFVNDNGEVKKRKVVKKCDTKTCKCKKVGK